MNNTVLVISAVFPPEPVVSAKLSMDLYKALKGKGLDVKVLHPSPTRPFGFKPEPQSIGLLGNDEITTESYVCPQSSIIGRMRKVGVLVRLVRDISKSIILR